MNKTILWSGVAVACAIAIGGFALGKRDATRLAGGDVHEVRRTIGDVWQLPVPQGHANPDEHILDAPAVRHALRNVRVDGQGNLVLDHVALEALRAGFSSLERLDDAELARLQQIIRDGLAAPAGDQAAELVSDYYRYQVAARSMSENAVGGDLESVEAQLNQVVALRESHFGAATAQALFGDEQAYTRFTIESMKIESDATLTDEMKDKKQAELLAMLPPRLQAQSPAIDAPASPNESSEWQARMAEFQRGRDSIFAAKLSEEERNARLHELLHAHFSAEEMDRALRDDPTIEHPAH